MMKLKHKLTDNVLSQRTRPIPSDRLSASDRHFYVPSSLIDGIEHKVPHFCQWIKFCHLLREGSRARIAVKVLMNYMDTIARRVSLNREIVCVTNIVTMLNISAMIYYAFNILSSPQQATVILPQILIDTMTHFDQKNCLTKQDYELFQACFVILPQILIDTMTSFDQKNCLTKQDYELFQACFDTFQIYICQKS